ncbi:hypothetical protein AB0B45_06230 [Nonomuraea sp. NPDC049152]|uniref:hypothetical protein n=1 Tax=Nonomuraea sp. NPDC049152 TaxID=3154350 RepID=UPI0033D67A3C
MVRRSADAYSRRTGGAASASATPPAGRLARSPRLGLEFFQDGTPSAMSLTEADRPVTTVALRCAPFELRFPTLGKDRAITTIFNDGNGTPMAEQRQDLYLAVFVDLDGDGVFRTAGRGEYEYLVLDFPS